MNGPQQEPKEVVPSPESLSGTVLRGGRWLGISAIVQAVLQVVIFAILARLLSPMEFGLVAIAGIFIDLGAGMAAMGTSQAVVQRPNLTEYHLRAAFWISTTMGISMAVTTYLASNWLASLLGSPQAAPLIAALSITFAIRALGVVSEGLAARQLNFRVLAIRQLAAYLIGYGIVGMATAYLGAGAWALVYAQITQASLATILLIIAVRFDCRPTTAVFAYREILGFGSGFSVARMANSLANQVDRAIVSMNTNPTMVGVYTRSLQLARYPTTLVGQVIEDVLFPSFADVQADRDRLTQALYRSIGSVFVIMTPVAVFTCVAAGPITTILLGNQWDGVVPLVAAFSVVIPFRSAQRISSAALRAVGRSWLIAALQILLLAATAAGALIGIRFGLTGTAIGVTAAFILHYLALAIASTVALSLNVRRLFLHHLSGIPLAILTAGGAATGVLMARSIPVIAALALSMAIAVTLVVVAISISPRLFLRPDGQWLASLILAKIPRKYTRVTFAAYLMRRIIN